MTRGFKGKSLSGRTLPLVAVLALCSMVSFAQDTNYRGRVPTSEEFVGALAPEPKMRGIAPASAASAPRAVNVDAYFDFDSAALNPKARALVDNLGKALRDERLASVRQVTIEGHTDAQGTAEYNQGLSERRAQTVVDYLVANYQIPPAKLKAVGKGEAELADPRNPSSGVNRRVRIVAAE